MSQKFDVQVLRQAFIALFAYLLTCQGVALAQSGLRESLERLDRNQNGEIEPEEITPLARPYLERVAEIRRMSLDRPNGIDRWQEAARVYYALKNGVAGKSITPEDNGTVTPFGAMANEPLVPEFGLPEVKFPYIQEDLDEADRTLRRSDRNRDGYIDRAEAARAEWTHRNPFDEDYDHDNRLSRLELGQRYARRRLLDGASSELVQKARRTGSGVRPVTPTQQSRPDDPRWWMRGGSRYYLTATVMGRFDLNKNGRLEPNEATSLGFPASRIDIDRDGELSRDELHTFLTKLQDEAGDISEGLPTWFYERDLNRDDQVEMSEFDSEWADETLEEFLSLDTNGDGMLTKLEVIQSKAMVGGTYTNAEAEVLPPHKTIISEIVVNENYLIADLNVQLSITHSNVSFLDAYLTGPDGQRIELFTNVGGSDDHFDKTVFDDQSQYPITKARPPFQGTFLPEAITNRQPSLSYFNGKSIEGVWQLVVSGTRSERFGMLHSWGLIVKPQSDTLSSSSAPPIHDGPQTNSPGSASVQAAREQPGLQLREFGESQSPEQRIDLKLRDKTKVKDVDSDSMEAGRELSEKQLEKYKQFLESKKFLEGEKAGDKKRVQ